MIESSSRLRLVRGVLLTIAAAFVWNAAEARQERGPYARIAVLRPHDGRTTDFEAGYIRHLEFHRRAKDPWRWFGWTVWAGERQRWFVYATFGHAAADFDQSVSPADDERDNVLNVTPHAQFAGNAVYEFLPALSRGTAEPSALPLLELTTVDVQPGASGAFEAALGSAKPSLGVETLWYRLTAGGPTSRYVRLRPQSSIATVLAGRADAMLPEAAVRGAAAVTLEILTLRPTMSYGLPAPVR
jgi:hypothetical protein